MFKEKEKQKTKVRQVKPAVSHEDEQLPPGRAAAQVQREAEFRRLVSAPLVDKVAKKPPR